MLVIMQPGLALELNGGMYLIVHFHHPLWIEEWLLACSQALGPQDGGTLFLIFAFLLLQRA